MFRCLAVGAALLVTTFLAGGLHAQQCSRGGQGPGPMRGGMQGGGFGQAAVGQFAGPAFQLPSYNQMAAQQTAQLQQLQMQQAYNLAAYRMSDAQRYQRHVAVRSQLAAERRQDVARQREENRARIAAGTPDVSGPLLVNNP